MTVPTPPAPSGGHLVVFDPSGFFELCPLSLTRPVFGLRCGIGTLLDNQVAALRPDRVTLWVRPALETVARRLATDLTAHHGTPCGVNAPLDGPATLVDGRTWWFAAPPLAGGTLETDETRQPLRWSVDQPGLTPDAFYAEPPATAAGLARAPCAARVLRRWWDLIAHNEAALRHDAVAFAARTHHVLHVPPGVHLLQPGHVRVGRRATLAPGCVLDASGGMVCVDEGASVGANAVLIGPCYVGVGATIHPHATLRPGPTSAPAARSAARSATRSCTAAATRPTTATSATVMWASG